MNQRIVFLFLVAFFSASALAESGNLSEYEMDEIFDDVNHGAGATASAESSSAGVVRREKVDDDEDAADEMNHTVGDSLVESNSFQSYRDDRPMTAERFIHGDSNPGSYTYQGPVKAKKGVKKRPQSKKKVTQVSVKKSRQVASSKKSKRKRGR